MALSADTPARSALDEVRRGARMAARRYRDQESPDALDHLRRCTHALAVAVCERHGNQVVIEPPERKGYDYRPVRPVLFVGTRKGDKLRLLEFTHGPANDEATPAQRLRLVADAVWLLPSKEGAPAQSTPL